MTIEKTYRRDIERELRSGTFDATPDGLLLPKSGIIARGLFTDWVNGEKVGDTPNLVVDQGFVDILNTYFGATSKKAGFYVALYAGAISPAANWTAANFASTASEITSGSEGYSQATRPQWVPAAATTPQIDNYASKAAFTIVTASILNVNGVALLSESTKGSTSGVLDAATRYGSTRQLQNTDAYEVGYRIVFAAG